uniref:Uncharacterized protein n=1 Tax=Onchocerca volvulus TaxID=6282 RepID=A0A8R1XQT2_ONCVO
MMSQCIKCKYHVPVIVAVTEILKLAPIKIADNNRYNLPFCLGLDKTEKRYYAKTSFCSNSDPKKKINKTEIYTGARPMNDIN